MSTSDAAERALSGGGGGGETTTLQFGTARPDRRTTAPREHEHKTFDKSFEQENHCVDEAPTGQQPHSPASRQNNTHEALILGAGRQGQEEAGHCEDSRVQTRRPFGPRFTSSLYFRFSKLQSSEDPESGLERNLESCQHSLTDTQAPETGNSGNKDGQTPSPDAFLKETSDCRLSETIQFPVKKKRDIFTDDCNQLGTIRNLATTHSFSDRQLRQHECNGLHRLQDGSQPKTLTRQVNIEEDHTKFFTQTYPEELSDPARTMLSSSVVTVLAPHWSGRLRRSKRFDGTGSLDAQGNLQDVTNTASKCAHDFLPKNVDKLLTDGSQAQSTVPFLGTRRNTVGWSTKSGPASLDYDPRRKMSQTFSLDVNSGRMDSRNIHSGALRTPESPVSPLSLEPNEQMRTQQTGHQGLISSSKPMTSSLLLSLRSGRTSSATSNLSEKNPPFLSSSQSDRDRKLFQTHLSQSYINNNEQERPKPLLSPLSSSYRTPESGPSPSPSPSNHREKTIFERRFFSTSPINKDAKDATFTQKPQIINRAQSTLLSHKQAFSNGEAIRDADKMSNVVSRSSVSSPTHSSYERSACPPRRTTLTSTSWWKKVTQEGSSPLTPSDTVNNKNKANTPLVPPRDDNSDLASRSPTYNKRFSPVPINRDNNNTSEPLFKGNMNLVGKSHSLKQSHPEDSPVHESDRPAKMQDGPNLNNRAPPKTHSLPDVLATSKKISIAPAQTTLSQTKDPSRHDVSNFSFASNVSELPPLLLSPKSSQTPTESSNEYNNNHCASEMDSTPTSLQNKDTQRFTKAILSPVTNNTSNSQALSCPSAPRLPLTPNTKSSSSFQSLPVNSQASSNTSSHTNTTPLGFKRSYALIPKHLPSENVSSPIPTVSALSKTNYSPVSAASSSSSSTAAIRPASTTVSSSSLLTPHVTTGLTSSPNAIVISSLLTPPATPVITSPKEEKPSSSQEKDPKKLGKRVRRVTWDDSVDLDRSESSKVEKPEPSPEPKSPSPPRSRSVKAPSIFSFLRSGGPTTNAYPVFSPTERTTSIHLGKGAKIRSLSSDSGGLVLREGEGSKQRLGDMTFDPRRQDVTTPRQERTLSEESGTAQYRSSAPLSLPANFSSGYKLRYSCPPYSTLKSTRSAQGETKTLPPRLQLFQQASQSDYTKPLSTHNDTVGAVTAPKSKPSLPPYSKLQPLSSSFSNKTEEPSKCVVSETGQVDSDCGKNSQDRQNGNILLLNNRVHVSSQSLQGDKSSTCVTETLVYSLKLKGDTAAAAPKDTTPKPLQHTTNTPVSLETKSGRHFDDSSSGSSSRDSQQTDDESSNRRVKDHILAKSRFFSVESNNEQSPKRSRFALKKSVSTPNPNLSRSDSERTSKTNKKMDQVINKLRQTFSTKRSDDDVSSLWKWRRASQTPSVSGSSDISDSSAKALEEKERERRTVPKDIEKETWDTDRWTQNRYSLIQPSASRSTVAEDEFYNWPEKLTPENDQDEKNVSGQHMSESKNLPHLTIHSPTTHQCYKDNSTDYTPTNQFLSHRDLSPGRSPNTSSAYSAQFKKSPSSPSPRSPFSPFSSLSPLSPFPSPDVTDDSVFYSPKLQRRREASSPCEPLEGISLGGSRRSRVSTGPPSVSPGQEKESSYADLKYGIEPGRSFSVSSVQSSRASRPGRISTGSRFMSVGDLSKSALACAGTDKDLNEGSDTPDWTADYDCPNTKDSLMSYYSTDPGKMKSRSLPRSLTRRLANWSSAEPVSTTTSKLTRLWTPMDTCHFAWDTEGPPTPPPTPPLSPVTRRMSKPPSVSSPTFPSSSEKAQRGDSQSQRGRLPSRGHVSSLSTYEESSDSSSDTTTDDEYYLETEENDEKETEL